MAHLFVVQAGKKLMDVITGTRKQHAEKLKADEFVLKQNRELWAIKGLGRPIYCELANRARNAEEMWYLHLTERLRVAKI